MKVVGRSTHLLDLSQGIAMDRSLEAVRGNEDNQMAASTSHESMSFASSNDSPYQSHFRSCIIST
jgi:hypothetical protein